MKCISTFPDFHLPCRNPPVLPKFEFTHGLTLVDLVEQLALNTTIHSRSLRLNPVVEKIMQQLINTSAEVIQGW